MGEIRVAGRRAGEALSWLLTQDVAATAVGQAQYNLMCNDRGGIVDDVITYRRRDDEFLVCVNASNRAKDFAWMVEHNPLPGEVVFEQQSDDWAQVAIQGPDAATILQKLTPVDLSVIKNYRFAEGEVCGIRGCIIARTGYTGEDGFEVFAPSSAAAPLWSALLEAGAPFGTLPIGLGARDTLRLEARMHLYGHELSDEISAFQAGLGRVVKLDKPAGFLGREAQVARRDADTRVLAGAILDGKRIVRDGMTVLADGREIGVVTSGTQSPTLGRGICLFLVEKPYAEAGTRVTFDVRGKEETGVVHAGPFYKRPR
jgi:aminomethyltransferase